MKRITTISTAIVFLLMLNLSLLAQSEFSVTKKSTNDTLLYIGDDGRVGIGTINPEASIDVKSAGIDYSSTIYLHNSNASHFLFFYGGNGGISPLSPLISWNGGDAMRFASWGPGYNEHMRISESGFLGIGTTDPQVKVDIQLSNNSGNERAIRALNPNMILNDALFFVLGRSDDEKNMGYMRFKYNDAGSSTNRLSFGLYKVDDIINITGLGNVGIGTTAPVSLLEVAGEVHSTTGGFKFPDGSVQASAAGSGSGNTLDQAYDQGGAGAGRDITADNGAVRIFGNEGLYVQGNINTGSGIHSGGSLFLYGSGNEGGQLSLRDGDDDGGWIIDNYGSTDNEALRLFRSSGVSNALVINELGDVGIGTGGPSEKLTVAGTVHSSSGGFRFPDGSLQTSAAGSGGTASNTLDQAYDQGGSGAGSTIVADAGAVTVAGVDGFLSTGTVGSGSIPFEGAGTRMMWYPKKSAFRAGTVASTQWDDINIGEYSLAMGFANQASGIASTAFGALNNATQAYTTALGYGSLASANFATAIGQSCQAAGTNSLAFGNNAFAIGANAISIGHRIIASGDYTMAIALSDQSMLNVSQNNTLAIMGGKVGIGVSDPSVALDVNGKITATDRIGIRVENPSHPLEVNGTIYTSDRIGIRVESPSQPLEVEGIIYSNSGGYKFPDNSIQLSAADSLNELTDCKMDSQSIFIGRGAGENDPGLSDNIAIGLNALSPNNDGERNVAIGNNALVYTIYQGTYSINDNVAIGYQDLDFDNHYQFGNYNVKVGSTVGEHGIYPNDTESSANVSVGYSALAYNRFGSANTAIGHNALLYNKQGSFNVANGYMALMKNEGTVFSWSGDLFDINDGSFNIALGYKPLFNNVFGFQNIAVGFETLYNIGGVGALGYFDPKFSCFNIALGFRSLFNNGDSPYVGELQSSYNIGIGYQTLYNNLNGNNNIALGNDAGYTNIDGDNNLFIGNGSDAGSSDFNNAIAIGYTAIVDASNKIRLGNDEITVIEGQVDFTYTSDKRKKENFLDLDSEYVLKQISTFNIQSWNYRHDPAQIRHYGPVAQEFYCAFGEDGLGTIGSDTTLCGSDVNGINMIAIQALEKRTTALKIENEKIKFENKQMQSEIDELRSIIKVLLSRAENVSDDRDYSFIKNNDTEESIKRNSN